MGSKADTAEQLLKNQAAREAAAEAAKAAGKVVPVLKNVGGAAVSKGKGILKSIFGVKKATTVPRTVGKVAAKYGAYGLGGLGVKSAIDSFRSGDQTPTPEAIDYAALEKMSSMTGAANPYADLLATYDKIAAGTVGGSSAPRPQDMTAEYNRLANISNKMGGATLAQMQNLAGLGAQTATGISAGAEAGRQALNDIYAKAAGQVTEASRMAGTEGSSLTPVSGILAALPSQIRESGATIGDYLKANQLVSANDASFLSELAKMQGTSYANQIANQDKVFLMADKARRRAEAQRQAAAAAASSADARLQAQLAALKLRGQIAEKQGSAVLPVTTDYETIASAWDTMTPANKEVLKKRGITNKTKYLNAALNDLKNQLNQG
jgi:hypothetical protein